MELVLNIDDIHKLVIKSKYGDFYQLVPLVEPEPFGEYLTASAVMDEYTIGYTTLKRWVEEGLVFIRDGKSVKYDKRDIDRFMENKKVGKRK